jgi:predicted dehydrogenase
MPDFQPVSTALIGFGELARSSILPRLGEASPIQIVSVFSPDLSESPIKGAVACNSFEEAIDRAEAVLILSPAQVHAQQTSAALRAGKHVYCQKPLGVNAGEVQTVLDAWQPHLALLCAPAMITYPTWQLAKQWLEQDRLGQVYAVRVPFMGWGGQEIPWPQNPAWRFQPGNGPIRDHGLYGLSALVSLFGRVESVMAVGKISTDHRIWNGDRFAVTEPDNWAVVMALAGGGLATFHECWASSPGELTWNFHGLDQSMELSGPTFDACPHRLTLRDTWGHVVEQRDASSESEIAAFFADGKPNAHVWADLVAFSEMIRGQRSPVALPASILHLYKVIDACVQSASEGRKVQLDS